MYSQDPDRSETKGADDNVILPPTGLTASPEKQTNMCSLEIKSIQKCNRLQIVQYISALRFGH